MGSLLPLLLLAALCSRLSLAQTVDAVAVAPRVQPPSARLPLALQMRDLCADFVVICAFVTQNCNRDPARAGQSPKCAESFNLFYQHNATLTRCIGDLPAGSQDKTRALKFLENFSVWQQHNACRLFHATEAKAAAECSGANAHRPWKQTTWPLYCHEVFTMYNTTRHELDELCGRTANSEAFWEGYVDYVGSTTCKRYYDMVREARERGCGEKKNALGGGQCREMFRWYVDNQQVIETDCYELKASKPFYRGFYTWKKQQP
ncbi:RxLR-like protein [Phytophthora cinnamomi]|uniref:RxLR-like protein n=1 Tax=Phytophthora cinnamomi TaxID=4785 RepID=UPI003559C6FD|nr:RxLR-like protein [Phytophthora cinnamomi]